ncbi:hypothetical protein, partial [Methyloceanibacter sp.]|uniref:hypothetical protein n=1 Tax=Methyloceanibacter sp. TaxID=1965321 RepID=UPI002D608B02
GLAGCGTPRTDEAAAPPVAYEPQGRVDRAPLPPPPGESAPSKPGMAAVQGDSGSDSASRMIWQSSPRWAAIKGNDKLEGDPAPQ